MIFKNIFNGPENEKKPSNSNLINKKAIKTK